MEGEAHYINLLKLHAGQQGIYNQFPRNNCGFRAIGRAGRRFGKTKLLETTAANWVLNGLKVGWFSPLYKYITPSFRQISRVLAPAKRSSSATALEFETVTGGIFEGWSLENEDAGRSRDYDWVIIDEGGLVLKGLGEIWETAILPTLLDRNGNAIMTGTPKGISENSFFWSVANTEKYGNWTQFHAPSYANPHLSSVALEEFKRQLSPLAYQQEILAEFVDWSGEAFFAGNNLLVENSDGSYSPATFPQRCDYVFAVIDTALKTGKENDCTAVTYFAHDKYTGHPLTVLDWDLAQIEGATLLTWLPSVFRRLEELAKDCGARTGMAGAFVEDKGSGTVLIQHAKARGWPAEAIPSKLTAIGKDERAMSVSGHVASGSVKISDQAWNKTLSVKGATRNHLWEQVTSYHLADPDAAKRADDLFDTFVYGIAISLGDNSGF